MNVMEYAYEVIDRKARLMAIQPSTARDYRVSMNAWKPHIGRKDLSKVSRASIERGMERMFAAGLSPNTVLKRYVALNMVLEHAVEVGDLPSNPMAGIPRPKKALSDKNALVGYDLERLKMMLSSLTVRPWVVAVNLCLYAGLRAEETCALTHGDVDLAAGMGWVRHAIAYGDGGAYLAPPKSGRTRDFPICEPLRDVLARWELQKGIEARPGDFLLGDGRKWADPRMIGRKWSLLCEIEDYRGMAGRKPTLHDLRHTFATACVRSNMDVKTLQSILGHSSAAVTLDMYASADPSAKRAAAALIASAI